MLSKRNCIRELEIVNGVFLNSRGRKSKRGELWQGRGGMFLARLRDRAQRLQGAMAGYMRLTTKVDESSRSSTPLGFLEGSWEGGREVLVENVRRKDVKCEQRRSSGS